MVAAWWWWLWSIMKHPWRFDRGHVRSSSTPIANARLVYATQVTLSYAFWPTGWGDTTSNSCIDISRWQVENVLPGWIRWWFGDHCRLESISMSIKLYHSCRFESWWCCYFCYGRSRESGIYNHDPAKYHKILWCVWFVEQDSYDCCIMILAGRSSAAVDRTIIPYINTVGRRLIVAWLVPCSFGLLRCRYREVFLAHRGSWSTHHGCQKLPN